MNVNRFAQGSIKRGPVLQEPRPTPSGSGTPAHSSVAGVLVNVVLLLAFVILAGTGCSSTKIKSHLEAHHTFKNYTLLIYRDNNTGDGSFEILRHGKRVHIQQGHQFQLGNPGNPEEKKPLVEMGRDITGQGVPNLVVSEWTGGAHCCWNFDVFEIGERFRKLATLEAGDSEGAAFEDLDGDGKLEFKMQDWTFAYWNTDFASSPAPTVILRYQQDEYRLAADLMRRPPPTSNELAILTQTVRSAFTNLVEEAPEIRRILQRSSWTAPPELWGGNARPDLLGEHGVCLSFAGFGLACGSIG